MLYLLSRHRDDVCVCVRVCFRPPGTRLAYLGHAAGARVTTLDLKYVAEGWVKSLQVLRTEQIEVFSVVTLRGLAGSAIHCLTALKAGSKVNLPECTGLHGNPTLFRPDS